MIIGDVQVAGEFATRPLLARLDSQGRVQWSKRLPTSGEQEIDFMALVREDTLLTVYQETDGGNPLDFIGSFNPQSGFAARFRFSLPGQAVDPFDFFAESLRDYFSQPDGGLSLVELEENLIKVLDLQPDGSVRFAKAYTMPEGASPFPGFGGTEYLYPAITQLANGDYYLTVDGEDLLSLDTISHILRLDSSGGIIWQAAVEMTGLTEITETLPDERILISGFSAGEDGFNTSLVVLSPQGQLQFARTIPGFIPASASFFHYEATNQLLLQGIIPDEGTEFGLEGDNAVLLLSNSGEKLASTAFALAGTSLLFHVGSSADHIFFEAVSFSEDTGNLDNGMLLRLDSANLGNPLAASYLEKAGPSAAFSSFFGGDGGPFIAYRDSAQDWITVNALDANLQSAGDCDVMTPVELALFDPEITLTPYLPVIATGSATVSDWTDAPVLTAADFTLEDTPLTREATCGDPSGEDLVNPWAAVAPSHPDGAKWTGIGWINDTHFPVVWHYTAGRHLMIISSMAGLGGLIGWDPAGEFWFWSTDAIGGWYYNFKTATWEQWG
jgi:hypothetical protein